jgi:photosystem II stability/assembly factor-like uncharacterized protein
MTTRLFVGTRKGLFTLDRAWQLQQPHFLGDPVSAVLNDAGNWLAALNLGHFGVKLRRSADQGKTWEEVPAPAYPQQPADAKGAPWKLIQVWTLEAGAAPGELWAGTIPGGLFRSTDGSATWSLVESLWGRPERAEWFGGGYDHPGIHSICVDPRDARHVTIGISCGGVWQTSDRGATWKLAGAGMHAEYMPPDKREDPNIQDPHRLAQCAAEPDVIWAQHHNGVFLSRDAGVSWRDITAIRPAKFGFAVAVHPVNPDIAWFVPAVKDECRVPVDAKLAVARTTDGGASFSELRKGLPQEHAYDLVYRHALAVDASGNCLAMGSTSGGLWISEDQGESWRCVSAHLPPIYCVRFA